MYWYKFAMLSLVFLKVIEEEKQILLLAFLLLHQIFDVHYFLFLLRWLLRYLRPWLLLLYCVIKFDGFYFRPVLVVQVDLMFCGFEEGVAPDLLIALFGFIDIFLSWTVVGGGLLRLALIGLSG